MDDETQGILDTPEDVEALFADEPTPAPEEQPAPEATEEVAEAPAETPAEEVREEVPELPQAEASPQDAVNEAVNEAVESAAEAEARKWADKYDTPEALENAYKHQVASATRLAQERAQIERDFRQVQEALQAARPELEAFQQWKAQQQGQSPEVQDFDYTDPDQVQAFINAQVQNQLNQHLQQSTQTFEQQQAAMRQQQEFEAKRNEFTSWQEENPDVVPGSDLWTAMNNVIYEFQYDPSQNAPVEENFPLNRESFAIAKTLAQDPTVLEMSRRLQFVPSDDADISLLRDAVSNPALADHLEANPTYLETIKGHSIARQLAGMPQAVSQAQQNAASATQQAADVQRRAAYVESDAPGTPASAAPGARANDVDDEFELIGGKVWEQERSILNR